MSRAASSTRWCPTPEQLMILEETYRSGVRTPNSSQIQHITAHLSFYGKIEGKNVFYWFQNHKARERQKLRRKLGKQLQYQPRHQHQNQLQHLLHYIDHPSLSSSNHQQVSYSNSPIFLSQERGELTEEGSSATSNYTWELMNIPHRFKYGRDWMTMVDVVASTSPCYSRPPLKTLQLFPINESCNASKQ